jgi:hypothetical protein
MSADIPRTQGPWPRRPLEQSDIELRPETWALLAELPIDAKITQLAVRYPRVANQLAENWSRPDIIKPYLDTLLIDDRGGREGFPADVVAELLRLSHYYETLMSPAIQEKTVWEEYD